MSNKSTLLGCDDKNLGASFQSGARGEVPKFNTFTRNVNTIDLKHFLTHQAIYKF